MVVATLEVIAAERANTHFDKAFGMVDALLKAYGESDLATRLWEDIPSSTPVETVSDLYGILVWSTPDNGHALTQATDSWLTECACERKCHVALNLDTYPFATYQEMRDRLAGVATAWPRLEQHCQRLLAERPKD